MKQGNSKINKRDSQAVVARYNGDSVVKTFVRHEAIGLEKLGFSSL